MAGSTFQTNPYDLNKLLEDCHRDMLEGTFQQSEFAADITAVHSGKATKEYQDASAFYDRTFITEASSH